MRRTILQRVSTQISIALLLVLVVSLLAAFPLGAASQQAEPCQQGATPTGCVDAILSPASLTADFYVDGQLAAAGANTVRLNIPAGTFVKVEALNVRDGSADFGDIYTYRDASARIWVSVGQTQSYTFFPTKVFIKGFLELTCDIRSVRQGENIACLPVIDGVAQPNMSPGETTSIALEPGTHDVRVEAVGQDAWLWDPAANERVVSITRGSTTRYVSPVFHKKGLLTITFNREGVVGDIYLDGELLASQATSAQSWVAPFQPHRIEGRNFTDPAALGIYLWNDARVLSSVGSGQERTARLFLTKEFLRGFIEVYCQLSGVQAGDDVACNVAIDDQEVGTTGAGERAKFDVTKGSHTVAVTLIGASSGQWETSRTQNVFVDPGFTSFITAYFNKLPTAVPAPAAPPQSVPVPVGGTRQVTLTGVGPHARTIYLRGQSLGNNPHAFSKVGDCDTASPKFLRPIDDGIFGLGEYAYLGDVITHFSGSFNRHGPASHEGFPANAMLDPLWAHPGFCLRDESPLACEYRIWRPSIALIMLREGGPNFGPGSDYYIAMEYIVNYSIDQGVIPVLTTLPYQPPPHPSADAMNQTVRQLARRYNVPLWDLWVTTESMPDRGVDHTGHLTLPPDEAQAVYFTEANFRYGMTHRNLEALQVLQTILHQVMQ